MRNTIRFEYDQKLEAHKAQLKAESEIALEKVRADLSIAAAERQIQFSRLHEKRATVIAELHAHLMDLLIKLTDYVNIYETSWDKSREERRTAAIDAFNMLIAYYPKNRIFLSKFAIEKIENIVNESRSKLYQFLHEVDLLQTKGTHNVQKWGDIFKYVNSEMTIALDDLECEFRLLLGNNSEPGPSYSSCTSKT
jgi:galactose-1-phosphate uridylyltransferase